MYIQLCVWCIGGITVYLSILSIYRLTFHPLARYPGPFHAKICNWSVVYQCYKGDRHLCNWRDHKKYGPVVRTSPNTLSFSTPAALHQIYGSRAVNVRKSRFYTILDSGSGASTTHTEINKEKHAARRRILSLAFSEAALRETEFFVIKNVQKFVRLLGSHHCEATKATLHERVNESSGTENVGWTSPINMSDWCNWLAYDVMGDLVFSKSYNCLSSEKHRRMPVIMTEGTKFGYWFAYLSIAPLLLPLQTTLLMQWLCGQTARDNADLITYATAQFAKRAALEEKRQAEADNSARKDIMHYLLTHADPKTGIRPTRAELEGDSLSLIGAGADTVATALSAILFYLSRYPQALRTITSEVRSNFDGINEIHSGPRMNSCIYLNACIDEALRLSPPVAAPLPREVMKGGLVIDGHSVPEGITVGVAAYVIQHDENIFPEPWSFRPERWIVDSDNSQVDVSRARDAMCPFSLGSRGCIGKAFAYIEMRIVIATLLWCGDLECYDLEKLDGAISKHGKGIDTENGRERVDEFQLFDCFGSDRDGPLLRFRQRHGVTL